MNRTKKENKMALKNIGLTLVIFCVLMAAVFFSFSVVDADSQERQISKTVILKSALVWRLDNNGDYFLPKISSDNVIRSEAVTVKGQIETIAVSWKFKGEVTLELSVDNGHNYAPVICGVPINFNGEKSGNQIRWKANIGLESGLKEVKIIYSDTAGVEAAFGQPAFSGFKVRQQIQIENPLNKDLFNYQVKIEVSDSGESLKDDVLFAETEADFKDIRFSCADGQTLLDYYLENIIINEHDRRAVFWVKIPQIPPQGLAIYIYYGNSLAQSLSSPDDVFDFFDNFEGEKLDSEKWDFLPYPYLESRVKLSNSLVSLDAAKLITRNYQIKEGIIEYRAQAWDSKEIRAIIREDKKDISLTQLAYSSSYEGARHAVSVGNYVKANAVTSPILARTFYNYRVLADKDNVIFQRYSENYKEQQAQISYKPAGGELSKGYIGFETRGDGKLDRVIYDWIRARKLAFPQPFISNVSVPQIIESADFSRLTLAQDGSIVLENLDTNGYYIPPLITSSCDINTVIVDYLISSLGDKAKISLDISIDDGKTWIREISPSELYSAPLDLGLGNQLKLQANIIDLDRSSNLKLEAIKIAYFVSPPVSLDNIYVLGAKGKEGQFIFGDTITLEWDNSLQGNNVFDVTSVMADFQAVGGEIVKMFDDGPKGGHGDKKEKDNIYTAFYLLPSGQKLIGNICVLVANKCGLITEEGKIVKVDTIMPVELAGQTETKTYSVGKKSKKSTREKKILNENKTDKDKDEDEDKGEEGKKKEAVKDINKHYKIKFGTDEAEIGDFRSKKFKPYMKIKRWGNECFFSIEIPDEYAANDGSSADRSDDKIEWSSSRMNGRFYKKPRKEITEKVERRVKGKKKSFRHEFIKNEFGGLEFEVILNEKPVSNVISLPIDFKGLKFYYQGQLTSKEIAQGVVRPEEIIDSYAVYHESKKDNQYETGKAFHIYRPKLIDNKGNWIWAKLNIDTENKILKITVDSDWLDKAVYPVIVDPEFGYMSVGSSAIPLDNAGRGSIFCAFEMTPRSITAYLENINESEACKVKYAIYLAQDSGLVGETEEVTIDAATRGWYEGLYSSKPDLLEQNYALVASGDNSDVLIYFDEGASEQGVYQERSYAEAWPQTAVFAYDNKMYSIYDGTTATFQLTVNLDTIAPTNQNTVFSSSVSKKGGATVYITSSGSSSNSVWFAPSGTTSFSTSSTKTTAGGTATSILSPSAGGSYKMYVIDSVGNYSAASTATLTVDNTAPTNQNTVFSVSVSKNGGVAVTIVSSGDASNNVWFAPSGTTVFFAGPTMTTASGVAVTILAPIIDGSYKMYVIDLVGNYSAASIATLTVDDTAPTNQDVVFAASISKNGGAAVT
ncbi:MAG: DUF2341 domain-containing protein, partial [Candidatus Omnitrophica bacterium]|nr:DUF2341 domain-containing protein [Candidatus Omnitrophota bacterium]